MSSKTADAVRARERAKWPAPKPPAPVKKAKKPVIIEPDPEPFEDVIEHDPEDAA